MIGMLSSAVLVARHFGGGELPGCGPKSACNELERTVWGTIPGIAWPTSFVGLAWFTGLLAAWSSIRSTVPAFVVALARTGAVVSLGLALVMVVTRKLCPYCLLVHLASLSFLVLVERARRTSPPGRAAAHAVWAMGLGFGLITAGLAVAELRHRAVRTSEAKAAAHASQRDAAATKTPSEALAGRFRAGPADASVRVVLFTDFQCQDCKRIEAEVREAMAAGDVSLVVKHFPMSNTCNEAMGASDLHPNACWAARAAEAAGILKGDVGFFAMCDWLFERSGAFTDVELRAALPGLGFDPREFERAMQAGSTEAIVKADIRDALGLGIRSTPLVFVNEVELRGWEVTGVTRAVLTELVANSGRRSSPRSSRSDDHSTP